MKNEYHYEVMKLQVVTSYARWSAVSPPDTTALLTRVIADLALADPLLWPQRVKWRMERRRIFLLLLQTIRAEGDQLIRSAASSAALDELVRIRFRMWWHLSRIRLLGEMHFFGIADYASQIAAGYRGFQLAMALSQRSSASSV
jgi:hypothetical protein